jgi:hypothetical protein
MEPNPKTQTVPENQPTSGITQIVAQTPNVEVSTKTHWAVKIISISYFLLSAALLIGFVVSLNALRNATYVGSNFTYQIVGWVTVLLSFALSLFTAFKTWKGHSWMIAFLALPIIQILTFPLGYLSPKGVDWVEGGIEIIITLFIMVFIYLFRSKFVKK